MNIACKTGVLSFAILVKVYTNRIQKRGFELCLEIREKQATYNDCSYAEKGACILSLGVGKSLSKLRYIDPLVNFLLQ